MVEILGFELQYAEFLATLLSGSGLLIALLAFWRTFGHKFFDKYPDIALTFNKLEDSYIKYITKLETALKDTLSVVESLKAEIDVLRLSSLQGNKDTASVLKSLLEAQKALYTPTDHINKAVVLQEIDKALLKIKEIDKKV
jgi:hypothetical protein